jgi:hypothetical protein
MGWIGPPFTERSRSERLKPASAPLGKGGLGGSRNPPYAGSTSCQA